MKSRELDYSQTRRTVTVVTGCCCYWCCCLCVSIYFILFLVIIVTSENILGLFLIFSPSFGANKVALMKWISRTATQSNVISRGRGAVDRGLKDLGIRRRTDLADRTDPTPTLDRSCLCRNVQRNIRHKAPEDAANGGQATANRRGNQFP